MARCAPAMLDTVLRVLDLSRLLSSHNNSVQLGGKCWKVAHGILQGMYACFWSRLNVLGANRHLVVGARHVLGQQ